MANKKTNSERLEAMFDALAESICNESDDELLEDLRQEGVDPEAEANRLKDMMLDTLKAFQQRGLVSAQEGYRRRVEQLEKKSIPFRKTDRRSDPCSRSSCSSPNTPVSSPHNTVT